MSPARNMATFNSPYAGSTSHLAIKKDQTKPKLAMDDLSLQLCSVV